MVVGCGKLIVEGGLMLRFALTDSGLLLDGKELMFMVMDDNDVHPTYDVGVWVNTPYFASALNNMFTLVWDGAKK